MGGQLGTRPALIVLHSSKTAEGAWQRVCEFADEILRPFRPAAPDGDLLDRPHLGVHADELGRQRAGADHQQPPRIGP